MQDQKNLLIFYKNYYIIYIEKKEERKVIVMIDKIKINKCLKEKAKILTTKEIKEKIKTTRKTQLDMFYTFKNIKGIIIGEELINIFQNELKDRGVDYNGKDEEFLEMYYGLAEILAKDYEDFEKILKAIGEEII